MKKIFSILLALSLLCGCAPTTQPDVEVVEKTKVGFICLHDENSTYDKNFIDAAKIACDNLGVQPVFKTNVPEGNEALEAAVELADEDCVFIFADSFGHEDYMIAAAQEFPDIQFAHATGTKAHTQGLNNYHNAFASIYEGRYLAGVAAGMKLVEMLDNGIITEPKIGYVGAFPYAEVISGYTSFYLGAKSICPTATMDIVFTGSWYDETAEKEAANTLIANGAVLISQHADSMGAPTACETAGVPNISYNGSTEAVCPNTFIVSSRINWVPYFEYAIGATIRGEAFDTDYTGTIANGSVELTDLGKHATAIGTSDELEKVKSGLMNGNINVFDTSTFTVEGVVLDSYLADVDSDPAYEGDTEVIQEGIFLESEFRSAPYFNLNIDGISLLETK